MASEFLKPLAIENWPLFTGPGHNANNTQQSKVSKIRYHAHCFWLTACYTSETVC